MERTLFDMPLAATKISDYGSKIGGAKKDLRTKGNFSSERDNERSMPFWANGFQIDNDINNVKVPSYNFYVNSKNTGNGSYFIYQVKKNRISAYAVANGFENYDEARKNLSSFIYKRVFRIGMDGNKYFIYKYSSDNKSIIYKDGFSSVEEAKDYLDNNYDELLNMKPFSFEMPHLDTICRNGAMYRMGNVDVQTFAQTFGFRGVEFGEWLPQTERQSVLNYAFDALYDLSMITGLTPKQLSLGGHLSIAFGSRGSGTALAHYEPQRIVFNLTRLRGAGSTAHEWFHALDHYLHALDENIQCQHNEQGIANYPEKFMSEIGFEKSRRMSLNFISAGEKLIEALKFTKKACDVTDLDEYKKCRKQIDSRLCNFEFYQKKIDEIYNGVNLGYNKTLKKRMSDVEYKRINEIVTLCKNGEIGDYTTIKNGGFPVYEKINEISSILRAVTGQGYYTKGGFISYLAVDAYWIRTDKKKMEKIANSGKTEMCIANKFYNDAKHMDRLRVKPYWSTILEMAARAFSAYCEDKLTEKDCKSQYLVHSTQNKHFQNVSPYPEGEDRKNINLAFEEFFKNLKLE